MAAASAAKKDLMAFIALGVLMADTLIFMCDICNGLGEVMLMGDVRVI